MDFLPESRDLLGDLILPYSDWSKLVGFLWVEMIIHLAKTTYLVLDDAVDTGSVTVGRAPDNEVK